MKYWYVDMHEALLAQFNQGSEPPTTMGNGSVSSAAVHYSHCYCIISHSGLSIFFTLKTLNLNDFISCDD